MTRWPSHDQVRAGAKLAGLLLVDDDVEGERKDLKLLLTDNINRAAARCGWRHRLCRRLARLLRGGARGSEQIHRQAQQQTEDDRARYLHDGISGYAKLRHPIGPICHGNRRHCEVGLSHGRNSTAESGASSIPWTSAAAGAAA